MAKDGGGTPQELVLQSWIMYAVGIALYLFRVYAPTPLFVLFFYHNKITYINEQIRSLCAIGTKMESRRLHHAHGDRMAPPRPRSYTDPTSLYVETDG